MSSRSPFWLLVPIKKDSPAYAECRRLAEEKAEEDDDSLYLNDDLEPSVVICATDLGLAFRGTRVSVGAHLMALGFDDNPPHYLENDIEVEGKDLNLIGSLGYLSGVGKNALTQDIGEWLADAFADVEG